METTNSGGGSKQTLKKIGYFILIVLIASIAKVLVSDFMKYQSKQFSASEWKTKKINTLSIEAPVDLVQDPTALSKFPEELQKLIDRTERYDGKGRGLLITASYITYKEGNELNLQGAADGSLKAIAQSLNDSNPNYTTRPNSVNGSEGITGDYEIKIKNRVTKVKSLFLRDGQTLYTVLIMYEGSSAGDEATERIFKSTQLLKN